MTNLIRKYKSLRLYGFDPLSAITMAVISVCCGQPHNVVGIMQFEFEVGST